MSEGSFTARRARTAAERRAVLHIAHTANEVQEPWSWYAARRLASPRRAAAEWWLGFEANTPITALLAYPLVIGTDSSHRPATGVGSVATLPPHRGRGLASRLVTHVLEEGPGDALLFSAIRPEFYARLGFVSLPCWGWTHAQPLVLVSDSNAAALRPVDPRAELDRIVESAEAHTRGLRICRTEADWADSIAAAPEDRWFAVEGGGTLRLAVDSDGIEIRGLHVPEGHRDAALQAVAGIAASIDVGITGWFPPTRWVESHFAPTPRATTLPMVRGDWPTETADLHPEDYF